jgi:hypothetical protein
MMPHQIMQDEDDAAADEEEKLLIITALLHLQARINTPPWRGVSKKENKRNKDRQRMNSL